VREIRMLRLTRRELGTGRNLPRQLSTLPEGGGAGINRPFLPLSMTCHRLDKVSGRRSDLAVDAAPVEADELSLFDPVLSAQFDEVFFPGQQKVRIQCIKREVIVMFSTGGAGTAIGLFSEIVPDLFGSGGKRAAFRDQSGIGRNVTDQPVNPLHRRIGIRYDEGETLRSFRNVFPSKQW